MFGVTASQGHSSSGGWLSRPFGLPLPDAPFGLTCAFARFRQGRIEGKTGAFVYEWELPGSAPSPCLPGSINEFALERYSGFFAHRRDSYVFRAWHEPWLIQPVTVSIKDLSLITTRFPWFEKAVFAQSAYAPLSDPVWLGRAHRLRTNPHRARAFLEMP